MDINTLGVIISLLCCFGGLCIWLVKLGNKWGTLERKIDDALDIQEKVENHEERLTTLEITCNIRHANN